MKIETHYEVLIRNIDMIMKITLINVIIHNYMCI